MAQINFPNYPKSPADIRSSDACERPFQRGAGTHANIANSLSPLAARRQKLCRGRGGVHSDDLAVSEDQVRGLGIERHGKRGAGREDSNAHVN